MSMLTDILGRNEAPWMSQPKPCDEDYDRWFPVSDDLADRQAKVLCKGCPAINPCLAYALEIQDAHAIMGGTSRRQRLALKPQTRRMGECQVCDAPLYGQPGQGGRRLYCSVKCKTAARRGKESAA